MLHRPQSLISPFGSTTSIVRAEPPATRTWCLTIRKALFLRPETPRHLGPIEPPAAGAWCFTVRKALFLRPEAPRLSSGPSLRRPGRGASLPAKPYSFVRKHHVLRPNGPAGAADVVPHTPQSLISSFGSTTSISRAEPPATRAWCFTARKALFLHPETPRHLVRLSLRLDVVLHRPQSLIPSSGSTTSIVRVEPPATRTWYFTVRKALFLRPEASRLSAGPSLRRPGRGASPSAKPYASVRRHHVLGLPFSHKKRMRRTYII